MSFERDPIFAEKWERVTEEQGGHEDKGADLYYSFLERAQRDTELALIVHDLERSIGEYADAVLRLSDVKDFDRDQLVSADRHRKFMHEALVGTVNRLSRAYAKKGIDNKWRRDIIGLERKAVGEWALGVARHVLGKVLPS